MCPFCDEPIGPRRDEWFVNLPTTTADTLPDLFASLWPKSQPEPRPTNPQGRRVTAELKEEKRVLCEQHRYEVMILPLSVQYQWPRDVSFYKLLGYLFDDAVEERLQRVFEYPWVGHMIADPKCTPKAYDYATLLTQTPRAPMLSAG